MKRLIYLSAIAPLWIISVSVFSINTKEFDKYLRLLSKPQKIEFISGKSLLFTDLRFLYLEGTENRPVMDQMLGNLPFTGDRGKGVLTLSLKQDSGLPQSPEGYTLVIKDKQAVITSRGEAGLFYGCQTVQQLLEDANNQQIEIPPCSITDYPGVPYRATYGLKLLIWRTEALTMN